MSIDNINNLPLNQVEESYRYEADKINQSDKDIIKKNDELIEANDRLIEKWEDENIYYANTLLSEIEKSSSPFI